jgi:hypothetical protein
VRARARYAWRSGRFAGLQCGQPESSAGYGILEENSPKAGHIHGSLDRGMSGHPVFEDFTMRNDAKLQAKIAKAWHV